MDRPRETFGTLDFEGGFSILGILRFSASSIGVSRILGDMVACLGLVNGVPSFKDGRVGAGFIFSAVFSTGRVGEDCDFTGAGVFLDTDVGGGTVDEGVCMVSAGCKRLAREMVGAAEGKRRLSSNGDWSSGGGGSVSWAGAADEFNSRFCGTRIELIAPPNDSDNRSEAVSVDSGGSVSLTGGAVGVGGGLTFFAGDATAAFFVGEGVGLGAVVGMDGNEISATSIVRKGCSLSD